MHYLFDRLPVSGHNPITMNATNRAAIESLKDSMYAARSRKGIRAQIAFEKSEAKRYQAAGKLAMVKACERAIAELTKRL